MAADKTFGFKVNEEVYDRAKQLIEASGLSSKEWFEQSLTTYEAKTLQDIAPEYARDLTEVEIHTTRIYELVIQMVQQSMHVKDHAVRKVATKLEKKERLLDERDMQVQELKQALTDAESDKRALEAQQAEQEKQLEESRIAVENSQLLLAEYKEKNDSLAGLVAKYQAYADENEQLKTDFQRERDAWRVAVQAEMEEVRQAERQKAEEAATVLQERHALALEKARLTAEGDFQEKLQAQMDRFNDRISELQSENDRLRDSYESRFDALLQAQAEPVKPTKSPSRPRKTAAAKADEKKSER